MVFFVLFCFCRHTFTNTTGKATIVPVPDGSVHIGQRLGLSNLDVAKINRLYNCSKSLKAVLSPDDTQLLDGGVWAICSGSSLSSNTMRLLSKFIVPIWSLWERMQRSSWRNTVISKILFSTSKINQTHSLFQCCSTDLTAYHVVSFMESLGLLGLKAKLLTPQKVRHHFHSLQFVFKTWVKLKKLWLPWTETVSYFVQLLA